MGQLERCPQLHASRHSPGSTLTGSGLDQLALELGEPAQDGQHQSAVGGRRIGPGVGDRAESGARPVQRIQDVQQVAGGPGETVESGDQHDVARRDAAQHPLEFSPVGGRGADLLLKQFFSPRSLEAGELGFQGLP